MIDSKEKQQSPQKCPKCSNTENLTVAVTCVPDRESTWGGRVVWDNNTATTCGACGFIGKVADFEPKDSYTPENEAAQAEIARGMARGDEKYFPARCRQMWGDPIEDETEIKRITDALLKAYPPRSLDNERPGPETEEEMEKRVCAMYGFDLEGERRREAGFVEEIRRRSTIQALSFREAKTMPEAPHEYVVRTPENEAPYVALFNLIVEDGVHETWRGRRYQYWYPGDGWKYWRMTEDIRQSCALNRARADTVTETAAPRARSPGVPREPGTANRRALSEPSMFNQGTYYPRAEAAAYGPDSMHEPMWIDTSFDFRNDASGKDPDTHSRTLRQYHKVLWSKPLPIGRPFYLSDATPRVYLHHHSELGEFFLSSDSVIATFTRWKSLRHIVELFPVEANEAFRRVGYTIGSMIVFPGNKIDGKQTINGARGFNRRIADRFDLTLECVRRHYLGQSSPLGETLSRYREFFALFESFRGYVDFFMLYDLVTEDCSAVKFFMPFDHFSTPSVPMDRDAYEDYRRLSIEFVEARNRRIDARSRKRPGIGAR